MMLAVAVQNVMGEPMAETDSTLSKGNKLINTIKKIVYEFNNTDDYYIEQPRYECSIEMMATRNYENFILSSSEQSIMFSPDQPVKVGPFFSWRWISFGTTFDLKNISLFDNSSKQEFEFSIYSSQIGVDMFYRRTGSDYKLRNVLIGNSSNISSSNNSFEDVPFDGINVGITGANAYYIFNHRRFSYPAAFSPGGTCQRISCGSWLAGAGYTRNTIDVDFDKLEALLQQTDADIKLDSNMVFHHIQYSDFNLSAGYAHTLVLAKDLMLCISGQAALAYKTSYGKTHDESNGFNFGKINLDGIGRFALVYNNLRWYAGANLVLRTNNYHTSHFATSNIYGTFNAFIGYNFNLKKSHKDK